MTNEELAILLPQINNLINAYEQGARKQLVRSDIKTVEAYALSLHMSPIQSMRFAMNTMDAVSLTPEEMESEYRAQTQSASNIETRSATKEFVNQYLFESECEIVGGDEFSDTEKIVGKDIKLGSQKIPSKLGYKLTNPVRVKVNLKPLQKMQETIEENSSKTLAECFDCNVVYTVDVMYPSIEVLWEFEKLLKGLLDAIKIIETNLSSAQMYSDICKMKAFVGINFLCPSMMTKINLMLPTLFMKYSLDLAKISMDLNFVLGGIFKVAISMIATFLENIRALIIPFVDCTIGAAKAVGGYIRSVAASISQGVDATTDIVNKAAQVVHKTALLVGEVFSEDPAGVFDRTKPIYKSLEDLKQQHLEAQDELAQLIAKFNENVVPKEVVDAEQSLSKSQFLLNALPVEYGGYYSGHLKENPIIKMCKKFYNDNFGDKRISTQYWNFWELGPQEFQEVLVNFFYAYMFIYLPEDFSFSVGGEAAFFEESEAIELKLSSLEKEIIEKKKELAKTVREIHRDSKDSLSYKMTQREKKIRDWSQGLDKSQVKPGENTMQEWLKTRYSVDIGNSYVDHEYAYLKTANRIGKAPSNFLYGAEQLLNKYVVGTLEDIKKYVNDFFGNIINALKNLNIMLEQNTFSQFSILGEIMQLVHIIRAFNLIKKLVDEGFEGCDKLSESKAQEKILKDALEEISEGKISAKVISKNNAETGSQDFYLNTYSKKSKFNHITDLKDCSDSASLLRKRNLNTDQLYDMMKESMV